MSAKLIRICAAGEKLAAQLGGVFEVIPAKLADFQRREALRYQSKQDNGEGATDPEREPK